jgi:hypothetical protein
MNAETMKAEDFDKKFDQGESVIDDLDLSKTRRPGQEQRRVSIDLPMWMIRSLDKKARRLRVPRQSMIKMWLAEKLEKTAS